MAEASESRKTAVKVETDNLSQLVARILNQLALSAWLPAAALVLMVALVLRLARVVDDAKDTLRPLDAIGQAFGKLSHTSWGGIVLMLVAIIVLTMLTQAFTFESIRVLEGYWGTNRLIEQLARARCWHFRRARGRLKDRFARLTRQAWDYAELRIRAEQTDPSIKKKLTDDMIRALKARVLNVEGAPELVPSELDIVKGYDWTEHGPTEQLRRMANLDKKLEDFPDDVGIRPTKLGNVIRHFEDETHADTVESFVEEVFDRLPFSLQVAHDEQRGRLDLYCSMTFVWVLVGTLAVLRFGWQDHRHTTYAIVAGGIGVLGAWFTYRAAVASARYYGLLLLQIAAFKDQEADTSEDEQEPDDQEVSTVEGDHEGAGGARRLRNLFGLLSRAS